MKKDKNMIEVEIDLPDEEMFLLTKMAKERGMTPSELASKLVEEAAASGFFEEKEGIDGQGDCKKD